MTRGYLTISILLFISVFVVLITDLANYVLSEVKLERAEEVGASAFGAAESGIAYYVWHLSVFPSGVSSVSLPVIDPSGGSDSGFSLSVSSVSRCNMLSSVSVTSTGTSTRDASISQVLTARFEQPSVFSSSTPDYGKLANTFSAFKNIASANGTYLPASDAYGYKIVFNSNGSFTASPVTDARQVWGFSAQNGWVEEHSVINTVGSATTYTPSSSCPVVFVADNAWIQGVVKGKVTIAAADLSGATDKNIYIPANLTYADSITDGIVAVAQGSVLVTLDSPDTLTLQGGFVGVKGVFGRNEYLASGAHAVPSDLAADVTRTSLTVMGSGMGKWATTTKWYDGSGNFVSGYSARTDYFDRMLIMDPPALTPTTTSAFKVVEWRQ